MHGFVILTSKLGNDAAMNSTIAALVSTVEALRQDVLNQATTIAGLSSTVEEQGSTIARLENTVEEQGSEIGNLTAQLTAAHSTMAGTTAADENRPAAAGSGELGGWANTTWDGNFLISGFDDTGISTIFRSLLQSGVYGGLASITGDLKVSFNNKIDTFQLGNLTSVGVYRGGNW